MKYRSLGSKEAVVSAVGLGCMCMSEVYGKPDMEECVSTLYAALDMGINFWDTADLYGRGANEELLSRVLRENREKVFLATKFGFRRASGAGSPAPAQMKRDGSPEYVRQAVEASLKRLKTDRIDLYYLHRIDPEVPVEDTVGAMAELAGEGKVRFLGLCEADAESMKRACGVHPIAALQSEYSILTRDIEAEILPAARALGIAIVPYAPLSRGLVTNKVGPAPELQEGDYRKRMARYSGSYFTNNKSIAEELSRLAAEKGVTAAQLALAWLLAQGEDIIPIPGTKRRMYLRENAGAVDIPLSAGELARIGTILKKYPDVGPRYH